MHPDKHVFVMLLLVVSTASEHTSERNCAQCPGLYCGRQDPDANCTVECTSCLRGYRSDGFFCRQCTQKLDLYNWLYLGFMVICVCALNFYAIDVFNKTMRWLLLLSTLVETTISFLVTLLLFEPYQSFALHTCGVRSIKDWYTVFFNPTIFYVKKLRCTQEAVYPLYSFVFVYLAFCLITMLILRGLVVRRLFCRSKITSKSLYAGLYILPMICVIQTCFAGVVYYIYPYLVLGMCAIGTAVYLSLLNNDFYHKLLTLRSLFILTLFCLAHGYGIVSLTEFKSPVRDGVCLLLVFLPFFFYLLTSPFTKPDNFRTLS